MERNVEISVLCQIYGKVLTEKQYEILNDYYNNDLSLSEIAENNSITRQAVRDILKKGENKLFELEDKISVMKKTFENNQIVKEIEEELSKIEENLSNIEKSASSGMYNNHSSKEKNNMQITSEIKKIRKQLKKLT